MTVRVRFAPSPTGYLHIGGARTALFNWLFARKMGGTFILRIEDTDEVRSTEESVNAIFRGMRWLGLDWDEGPTTTEQSGAESREKRDEIKSSDSSFGSSLISHLSSIGSYSPYFQIQACQKGIYKKYAEKLIQDGHAYYCYCSSEELEMMREQQTKEKKNPKYDGRCRNLTEPKRKEYEAQGRKPVVRLKAPETGTTEFDDIVRGHVSFENSSLDDFVLIKNSGIPTYNFAVVVDDHRMEITHVIRGDDHLSNTPKQILIYNALGWSDFVKNLKWAHLSMILGPDGSRLSKRHGATSVEEYQKSGYLPEAMVNYLALLGWSTKESQQLFEKEELIQKFELERCSKSAAIFDNQKLIWMNGEYLRKLDVDKLMQHSVYFLSPLFCQNIDSLDFNAAVLVLMAAGMPRLEYVKTCVKLEQEKFKLLTDIPQRLNFLLKDEYPFDPKAVEKLLKTPNVFDLMKELKERIKIHEPFDAASLENLFKSFAQEKGMKNSPVFHSIRVATSGRMEGPSLFHYLELLGKEKTVQRIEKAIEILRK